jgi:hypothetical protein
MVGGRQQRRALQPQLDEGGVEPLLHPQDAAEMDVACIARRVGAVRPDLDEAVIVDKEAEPAGQATAGPLDDEHAQGAAGHQA